MKKINLKNLVIAIMLCQLAGIIGSVFTSPSIPTWYASLVKPGFSPPNWLFGPVWISLYALMGISAYLIYEKGIKKKKIKTAIYIFAFQLVLNSIWSILFFGLHNPFLAFIEIIILWSAIILTIKRFYEINKTAAYLLIPYILWVSFAAVLNYYLYILNI